MTQRVLLGDRRARVRACRAAEGGARQRLVGTPPGQDRVAARRASLARRRLSSHQCAAVADDGDICRPSSCKARPTMRRSGSPHGRSASTRSRPAARSSCGPIALRQRSPPHRSAGRSPSGRARSWWFSPLGSAGSPGAIGAPRRHGRLRTRCTKCGISTAPPPEAWRALHRAFDQTAGRVVQTATLPALFERVPQLQSLRPRDRAVLRSVEQVVFRWWLAGRSDLGARPVRAVAAHRKADRAMTLGVELAQPWALAAAPAGRSAAVAPATRHVDLLASRMAAARSPGSARRLPLARLGGDGHRKHGDRASRPGAARDAGDADRVRRRDRRADGPQPQHGRADAAERLADDRSAQPALPGPDPRADQNPRSRAICWRNSSASAPRIDSR